MVWEYSFYFIITQENSSFLGGGIIVNPVPFFKLVKEIVSKEAGLLKPSWLGSVQP
jgi:hypothetical protein